MKPPDFQFTTSEGNSVQVCLTSLYTPRSRSSNCAVSAALAPAGSAAPLPLAAIAASTVSETPPCFNVSIACGVTWYAPGCVCTMETMT